MKQVSVRELRANLKKYLAEGAIISSRGKVVATILPKDLSQNSTPEKSTPLASPKSFMELPEETQKKIVLKAAKASNEAQRAIVKHASEISIVGKEEYACGCKKN